MREVLTELEKFFIHVIVLALRAGIAYLIWQYFGLEELVGFSLSFLEIWGIGIIIHFFASPRLNVFNSILMNDNRKEEEEV